MELMQLECHQFILKNILILLGNHQLFIQIKFLTQNIISKMKNSKNSKKILKKFSKKNSKNTKKTSKIFS